MSNEKKKPKKLSAKELQQAKGGGVNYEVVANILKKIAATQQSIISNLK